MRESKISAAPQRTEQNAVAARRQWPEIFQRADTARDGILTNRVPLSWLQLEIRHTDYRQKSKKYIDYIFRNKTVTKNIGKSVRTRLLNLAKEEKILFL